MLMPKKVKHRKQQRGRLKGSAKGGTEVAFGEYGIQALEPGWITARQIEAARIAMTRHIKRGGKVWINVFPDKPVTAEAGRDPHGLGQGQPRALGRRREARPRDVRAVVPQRRDRQGSAIERAIQKLPIKARVRSPARRRSDGRTSHRAARARRRRAGRPAGRGQGRSCSTCASSTSPASSTTPPGSAKLRRDDRPHQHDAARARDRRGRGAGSRGEADG